MSALNNNIIRTCCAVLIVFMVPLCVWADDSLPDTLQSASELDYPPFALVLPDGRADGFSVDLLKAAVHAVGMEVTFETGPWQQIKMKLIHGMLDVLPLVSYSPERDKVLDFTVPYLRMHGTIFVRRGDTEIGGMADLKDREVLVMRGDTAHEYAVRKKLSKKLILTDSYTEAMKLLAAGKHDAVLVQHLVGLQILQQLGIDNVVSVVSYSETNLKPATRPLEGFEQKFCFAVKEGNAELLGLLNEGLTLVFANGTYDNLYTQWFSPLLPREPVPFITLIRYLIYILVPLVLLLTLGGIWYLNRKVKEKTRYLNEEKTRAQYYLDITASIIVVVDLRGSIVLMNKKGCILFGYEQHDVIGKDWFGFFPVHDKVRAEEVFTRIIKDNSAGEQYIETHVSAAGDGEKLLAWRIASVRSDDGRVIAAIGSAEDITERKKAEALLRKSEERYRMLFEGSRDGIVSIDAGGRFLEANPAYCDMLGYSLDELRTLHDFYAITPESWREWEQKEIWNRRLLRQGYSGLYEKEYIRKDGTVFPVELQSFSVMDKKGKLAYLWGIARDITERKESEKERNILREELFQTQKMESIGTLAGGIAHDFNNILGAIVGFTEMSFDDLPDGHPVRYNLGQIMQSSMRARDLVRQILAFSRKGESERKILKLQPVLKEVVRLLRSTIPTTISIQYDIAENVGPVLADSTQLHQVVMNLATNASHAMREKGGKLEISLCEQQFAFRRYIHDVVLEPGIYVVIKVADTGVGMSKVEQSRIFEPFYTTKGVGEGTGMGLAVVHGIVRGYGGAVDVESSAGVGTTFLVYLSRAEETGEEEQAAASDMSRGTERVLFVDDEELLRDTGRRLLESLGYRVTVCEGSKKALAVFREDPQGYDVVITDQTMPDMTGYELAGELMKTRKDIPVILCTGYSETVSEEKAKGTGIREYILKPLDRRNLAQAVRKVLDEKG